jgi:hypothetical protein
MAICEMKNPPEFSFEVRKWDRETIADGQVLAVEIEQLFNNTFYNKAQIERMRDKKEVVLTASGWSGGGPYIQTVAVAGILADDESELGKALKGTETIQEVKEYNKAFGFIYHGKVQDGEVTFQAYKKPSIDIAVALKGV